MPDASGVRNHPRARRRQGRSRAFHHLNRLPVAKDGEQRRGVIGGASLVKNCGITVLGVSPVWAHLPTRRSMLTTQLRRRPRSDSY